MTDLAMRKRAAAHAGEVGLFVDTPVFEEDFGHIKMNAEVQVKATTPRSLRQHKYAWALATKIAEACDWLETKDDAMDWLLIEAKHFRRIYDPLRKIAILKPKPTNFGAMDGSDYTRLLSRMKHVAITLVVPGLDETALKAEIEAMIGPDTAPTPEPPKQPRERRAARKPAADDSAATAKEVHGQGASDSSNRVAPADSPPPESRPEGPTNEAEYIAACRNWISKQTASHEDARSYFEGEHHVALRQRCKVGIGTRNLLRRELAEHYEKGKPNDQKASGTAAT